MYKDRLDPEVQDEEYEKDGFVVSDEEEEEEGEGAGSDDGLFKSEDEQSSDEDSEASVDEEDERVSNDGEPGDMEEVS